MAAGGSYSYNYNGERTMQFEAPQNVLEGAQSLLFGKYSTPEGQEFLNSGYDGLNYASTQLHDSTDMSFEDLNNLENYAAESGRKKTETAEYINNMNYSTSDKWELYKTYILNEKNSDGEYTALNNAQDMINKRITTEEEYMDLYNDMKENNIEISEDTIKTLNKNDISLDTYVRYKTDEKKTKKDLESGKLTQLLLGNEEADTYGENDRIEILQNGSYSSDEKEALYNAYGSDSHVENYNYLKELGDVNIDDYFEFIKAKNNDEFATQYTYNGKTLKGDAVKGSADKLLSQYLSNSNFSQVQVDYLYVKNMSTSKKATLQHYASEFKQIESQICKTDKEIQAYRKNLSKLTYQDANGKYQWSY